jgi:hypothetical protein
LSKQSFTRPHSIHETLATLLKNFIEVFYFPSFSIKWQLRRFFVQEAKNSGYVSAPEPETESKATTKRGIFLCTVFTKTKAEAQIETFEKLEPVSTAKASRCTPIYLLSFSP